MSYHDITEQISRASRNGRRRPGLVGDDQHHGFASWLMLGAMLTYLVARGIGVWGNNSPAGWAWDITNFVWWIGIGHAGTLISAILFLLRQKWRTAINRAAEAMTIFAVACAAHLPAVSHRPSVARRLLAVPDSQYVSAHVAELPQPA